MDLLLRVRVGVPCLEFEAQEYTISFQIWGFTVGLQARKGIQD